MPILPPRPPEIFTFGKYKGRKISDIVTEEPSYVTWAYRNIDGHGGVPKNYYDEACELDQDDPGEDETDESEEDFFQNSYGRGIGDR